LASSLSRSNAAIVGGSNQCRPYKEWILESVALVPTYDDISNSSGVSEVIISFIFLTFRLVSVMVLLNISLTEPKIQVSTLNIQNRMKINFLNPRLLSHMCAFFPRFNANKILRCFTLWNGPLHCQRKWISRKKSSVRTAYKSESECANPTYRDIYFCKEIETGKAVVIFTGGALTVF